MRRFLLDEDEKGTDPRKIRPPASRLHLGHPYLMETALAETDALTVLIYDCPETTSVPLSVCSKWIRELYPTAQVIDVRDGRTEVGDTPEIRKMHEDFILNRLGIGGITHFYSGEFYGDHMSRALGAVNRQVDPNRERFPVCGTDAFSPKLKLPNRSAAYFF